MLKHAHRRHCKAKHIVISEANTDSLERVDGMEDEEGFVAGVMFARRRSGRAGLKVECILSAE
jgi:hypothetical protein